MPIIAPVNGPTHLNGLKNCDKEPLDGFATRAIHVGSEPDPNTGAVIPAISLSTTYKLDGLEHSGKVRLERRYKRN